jgi:hypothetical protein
MRITMRTLVMALLAAGTVGGCAGPADEVASTSRALTLPAAAPEYEYGNPCNGFPSWPLTGVYSNVTVEICPPGYAMQGIYGITETFYCRKLMEPASETNCVLESNSILRKSPNNVNVLACPAGKYMKGYHKNLGRIVCCNYEATNASTNYPGYFDGCSASPPPYNVVNNITGFAVAISSAKGRIACTDNAPMHACRDNQVMEGLHLNNNWLICGL